MLIAAQLELYSNRCVAIEFRVREHGKPAECDVVSFRELGRNIIGDGIRNKQRIADTRKFPFLLHVLALGSAKQPFLFRARRRGGHFAPQGVLTPA